MPIKWLCRFAQLAVALLGTQLAACTTVEIHTLDGAVKIERHVGVLAVELKPNAREQVVSATGIGIFVDGREFIVGYHNVKLALLGADCRLVVWIEKQGEAAALHELLGDRKDLCVVVNAQ